MPAAPLRTHLRLNRCRHAPPRLSPVDELSDTARAGDPGLDASDQHPFVGQPQHPRLLQALQQRATMSVIQVRRHAPAVVDAQLARHPLRAYLIERQSLAFVTQGYA